MFKKALTRQPSASYAEGISSANLGKPDVALALQQHHGYIKALQACGLEVDTLDPLEVFPDSCFVEDTAIMTERVAIITRPGSFRRLGEEDSIEEYFSEKMKIDRIIAPGSVDGGDVMRVENHFYIGISDRTNEEGVEQLVTILEENGYTGSVVSIQKILHLKTGINYIGDNHVLIQDNLVDLEEFEKFEKIIVPEQEAYAANCLRINEAVIVPAGFPETKSAIASKGFKCVEIEMSEFQKMDGGLSCLSL